jgi:(2Fe-2S) ferredoxin
MNAAMARIAAPSTTHLSYSPTPKVALKSSGLSGAGRIRVNKAGCLDACNLGPVMVIYPEGTWYTFIDTDDIEEIIQSHLIQGKPVERLFAA